MIHLRLWRKWLKLIATGMVATVYPKKYAHGFCFAVLCFGYTLTDFPISIRLTSLALWQSNDCPSASKVTLMNMDKYFMWIHYERLHNHNKAKHNKTVCIFPGIYCIWHKKSWRRYGSMLLNRVTHFVPIVTLYVWHLESWSLWAQVIDCQLFGGKLLPEQKKAYWQIDPMQYINFEAKYRCFLPGLWIWKHRLRTSGFFFRAPIC